MTAICRALLALAVSFNAAQTPSADPNQALKDAFAQGRAALDARQYDAAIAALTKAAELAPKQAVVWSNLGEAYSGLAATKTGAESPALLQKSVDAWGRVVALQPGDASSHNNYALALAKAGRYAEAEKDLIEAATLDHANAFRYYFNFGAILVNLGSEDAAAIAFRMAIGAAPQDPRNAEAYYQNALCLTQRATLGADGTILAPPGTLESFRRYQELAPNGPNASNARRIVALLQGKVETHYRSPAMPDALPDIVTMDGRIWIKKIARQPQPVYPPEALLARVAGVVELHAVVAPDGSIWELTAAPGKGHPFLVPAALDAVKQWVYDPLILNGKRLAVETTIEVNFRINR